jgi:hypothetical protein
MSTCPQLSDVHGWALTEWSIGMQTFSFGASNFSATFGMDLATDASIRHVRFAFLDPKVIKIQSMSRSLGEDIIVEDVRTWAGDDRLLNCIIRTSRGGILTVIAEDVTAAPF